MGTRRFICLSLTDLRPGDVFVVREGCVGVPPPGDGSMGDPVIVSPGTCVTLLGLATVRVLLPDRRAMEVRPDMLRYAAKD